MSTTTSTAHNRRIANGPLAGVVLATTLLLFGAMAPVVHPMVSCSMPCCNWMAVPAAANAAMSMASSGAACADHCGIRSNSAEGQLPTTLAASSEALQLAFVSLEAASDSDIAAARPARVHPPRIQTAGGKSGDAPLYLYNSVFLI